MAARFWVGGAGTLDNTGTTNYANSSGGAATGTPLAATDTLTIDGASGLAGGTITAAAGTINMQGLTCDAMIGTLDFATNAPTVNLNASGGAFSATGTAVRTINLGASVWNITA